MCEWHKLVRAFRAGDYFVGLPSRVGLQLPAERKTRVAIHEYIQVA
jgi:hypothetical protein